VAARAFAGVHGAGVLAAPDAPLRETQTLEWLCETRAALAALEAFLARRAGQLAPCWVPSFRQDATIVAWGDGGADVRAAGTPRPSRRSSPPTRRRSTTGPPSTRPARSPCSR
jgi:hypothetical protein